MAKSNPSGADAGAVDLTIKRYGPVYTPADYALSFAIIEEVERLRERNGDDCPQAQARLDYLEATLDKRLRRRMGSKA